MKKIPTVHELRALGYKVRVTHVRKFYRFDPQTGKKRSFWSPFLSRKGQPLSTPVDILDSEEYFISIHGGETVVEIADMSGKEIGKGVAVCSELDPYVKSIGTKKAIALALVDMNSKRDLIYSDPYLDIRKMYQNINELK
jgi:hypothetical protein